MHSSNQKSEVVDLRSSLLKAAAAEICGVIRRHRLGYDQLGYCVKEARKAMGQHSPQRAKRLPKNLSGVELQDFFSAIKKEKSPTHEILFQLLFVTGCRVSELCNIRRDDVNVEASTIFIRQGKGKRDRVVMFPNALQLPLKLYMDGTRQNVFLFESRRREKFSSRWIQTLAKKYGDDAGVSNMHPHRLRHSLLTQLASDLTDAELQCVSGHSSRSSLEVYTKLSQRDVKSKYQDLMR